MNFITEITLTYTPLDPWFATITQCHVLDEDMDLPDNNRFEHSKNEVDVTELAAQFLSEAKSRICTLSNVQSVTRACEHMFNVIIDDIYDTCKHIKSSGESEKWDELFNKLSKYRQPFRSLHTDSAQSSYLEDRGFYVKPETFPIGNKQTFVTDKQTGFKKPVRETVSGQHNVLCLFFS